jgi:hypothetical protein
LHQHQLRLAAAGISISCSMHQHSNMAEVLKQQRTCRTVLMQSPFGWQCRSTLLSHVGSLHGTQHRRHSGHPLG